jgi:diguanylate cyclase (GGDEF)-like protein
VSTFTAGEAANVLKRLGRRDLYLWSLCGFVAFVVTLGISVMFIPNALFGQNEIHVDSSHLLQLLISFLCLVTLFAIYVTNQRRDLVQARDALYRHLLNEEQKAAGLLDSDTQTYSSLVLEAILDHFTKTATATSPLTVLNLQINDLPRIQRRNGDAAVAHIVRSAAEILRGSLRGSDRICRASEGAFVVLLPNTPADCAPIPIKRILEAVARWNELTSSLDYRLSLDVGVTTSSAEVEPARVLLQHARQTRFDSQRASIGIA